MAIFRKPSEQEPEPEESAEPSADKEQIKVWQEDPGDKTGPEKDAGDSVEALQKKSAEYYDQLLRLQAEFANFRKRSEKEKLDAIRFGREAILERMIALNDVMESALKHSQNATDIAALKKGFEMVLQEFSRFLKSEGAQELKTVGETFDPHLHEAIEQVETDQEKENNKILEETQKGYLMNGRLIRPAIVKVAKFKSKKE